MNKKPDLRPLHPQHVQRLLGVAKTLRGEADTWADGFAVRQPNGALRFGKDDGWAEVRYLKIVKAAEFTEWVAHRLSGDDAPHVRDLTS